MVERDCAPPELLTPSACEHTESVAVSHQQAWGWFALQPLVRTSSDSGSPFLCALKLSGEGHIHSQGQKLHMDHVPSSPGTVAEP